MPTSIDLPLAFSMPAGQDLIVAIVTLGALIIILRNIAKGRRSACGRGGCGCGTQSQPLDDRMGKRKDLVQLQVSRPGNAADRAASQANAKG